MPLPPNPRGNSVDTLKNDAQIDARPNPQIQTPAAKPIPHPGCSPAPTSPHLLTPHHAFIASPHRTSPIPSVPLCLRGESPVFPHPTSQLTDSASHELAKLKSQLHALASPDGFAPTRDEFARAIRRTSRPYCKFFKTYDDFIRSCGLRSAVDRRRELAADQRAAAWAAARDPSPSSPAPSIANSLAHHNSEAPSMWEAVGSGVGAAGSFVRAPSSIPLHQSSPFAKGGGGIAQRMRSDDGGGVGGFGIPQASLPQSCNGIRINPKPNKPTPRTNEPFYGDPIHCCEMAHAPVNEQGVVLLFGMLAKKLNFRIEMVRTGYPDCEAKRKGPDGKWRRLRIEFEFKTSRFNHDPAGCDLIVCWEDDANPTNLEVLELKNHVGQEPSKEPEHAVPLIAAPSDQCVPLTQLAAPSDQCVPSAAADPINEPDPAPPSDKETSASTPNSQEPTDPVLCPEGATACSHG